MQNVLRKVSLTFFILLSAVPCHSTWGSTAALTESVDPAVQEEMARLNEAMEIIDNLQSQIDHSAFALDAALDSSDYEAEAIIDFVKSQFAFEQYPGTLRGPKGTLISRSGNALDQSLLLAKLLRDAGYDARIANATLAPTEARLLLEEMLTHPAPPQALGASAPLESSLMRLSKLGGLNEAEAASMVERALQAPEIEATQAFKETHVIAGRLQHELEGAGITLATEALGEPLVNEASDYYWVQLKPNAAVEWKNVHPAFSGEPKISPKAVRFLTESVPPELQHRVRLEMLVEVLRGGHLETAPVMTPYERPAANLFDQPLVLSNVPDGFSDTDVAAQLDEALEKTGYFMPFLNNTLAPGGKFFDTKGHVLGPEEASSPFSAIFATAGEKAGQAVSALGQIGVSKAHSESALPPEALTAQWIDIVIIKPGGREVRHRRTVFDRLGESGRSAIRAGEKTKLLFGETELKRRLTMTMRFAVGVGRLSDAFVANSQLQEVKQLQPVWSALVTKLKGNELEKAIMSSLATPRPWQGGLKLLQLFDVGAAQFGNVNYRSGPTVLAHRQEFPWKGEVTALVDIISNERRVFSRTNNQIQSDALATMKTGIWETLLEGSVLPPEVISSTNTVSLLEDARKLDIKLKVIGPGQSLGGISVNADTALSLQADLNRGFAVIVPERPPSSGRWETAWWRVNSQTGVTTGVAGSGEGLELVDYVIMATVGGAVLTGICVAAKSGRSGEGPGADDVGICGALSWGAAMTLVHHPLAKAFGLVLMAFGTGWWLGT